MNQPVKIFIAYARKDSGLLDEFRSHFSSLVHTNEVEIWYDGELIPSTIWEDEIREQMHQADVILMLLSPDSIASEYFYKKELPRAMERHSRKDTHVVPVILRPCVWEPTPLGNLQAVPKNGKPITLWDNRDEAYLDAVKSIQNIVKVVKNKNKKSFVENNQPTIIDPEPPKPITESPPINYFWIVLSFTISVLLIYLICNISKEGKINQKTESSAWEKTKSQNTIPSYQSFLDSFPDGEKRDSALKSIKFLEKRVDDFVKSAQSLGRVKATKDTACRYLRQALKLKPGDQRALRLQRDFRCVRE